MPEPKAREQFVRDFLLVAENDQMTYSKYVDIVKEKGIVEGAKFIQEDFENWINDLATAERASRNEVGSLLLRQLLIGWGADAFLSIAIRFQEDN